ncbi:MAG: S4 domain-containing protein [Verrucomicrobiota bacterium]
MAAEEELESVRLDVWLWAVRLYKTRKVAVDGCKNSRVLINGQRCKASRPVRRGDVIEVTKGPLTQTVKVVELLTKRVGAKLVPQFLEDQTPQEVYDEVAQIRRMNREAPKREAGAGRPTKRERRELDEMMDAPEDFDYEAFEKFAKAMAKNYG